MLKKAKIRRKVHFCFLLRRNGSFVSIIVNNFYSLGDFEVSISERIAKRKRNSKIPDTPTKGK